MSDYELIDPPASRDKQRSVLRYTVLLALAFLVGAPGAYIAWSTPEASYTAEGRVWIEGASGQGSHVVTAIRSARPQEPNAWIELLRSYQVLEAVVVEHKLYVRSPEEHAPAFASFTVADQFLPGAYRLRVGAAGEGFVLFTGEGALVQQGPVGTPIGQNVGFLWAPMRGSFAPGTTVEFSVLSVRDAARDLSAGLMTILDREGDFLRLRLIGPDRQATVDILNSLMEQYVGIAAELKRSKLNETVALLEEQLHTMGLELARAERELEAFRVTPTRLPSGRSMPIAAGLEITRDPVFGAFFQNKVEVEQLAIETRAILRVVQGLINESLTLENEMQGYVDWAAPELAEIPPRTIEEGRLRRRVTSTAALYNDARGRVETARLAAASSIPDIRILDRASVPR